MIYILPINYFSFKAAYTYPLLAFIVIWIMGSLLQKKYLPLKTTKTKDNFIKIISSNTLILLVVTFIMFMIDHNYSRFIILGTFCITTILELLSSNLYLLSVRITPSIEDDTLGTNGFKKETYDSKIKESHIDPKLIDKIKAFTSTDSLKFILKNISTKEASDTLFVSTNTRFNIDNQNGDFHNIVNLQRINDIQRINKFFESVNQKLPLNGIFIGCSETHGLRKKRILKKYIWGINGIYYCIDFLIKRVFPKLLLTKGIYFFLTRGQNRVISKAETLGRLYSCGFEIIEDSFTDNLLYFAARKIKEPAYDMNPTYGPLIKLRRVGKNGLLFNVYKIRTMHPYAEYLQAYVYQKNSLQDGGKFKNDFRITTLGRLFRKFWIDELPMLRNLFKGNMKLVGVRPISQHYFDLYSDELKQKRIKTKPGLFPPFYLDMPKSLDEIMESELRYLDKYSKKPFSTDFVYFWKILFNIFIKKERSK